jgi:hypothetical protein
MAFNTSYYIDINPIIANEISKKYTEFIKLVFPNAKIFDIKKFMKIMDYKPTISSLLNVGFGSCDYSVSYLESTINIHVHNGTLAAIFDVTNKKNSIQEIVGESFNLNQFIFRYLQKINY